MNLSDVIITMLMLSSIWKFLLNWNSLLSSLIILEFMALSVFFLLMVNTSATQMNTYMALIYMTIAVCDGVLGISMLLLTTRLSGSQVLLSQNMLKW